MEDKNRIPTLFSTNRSSLKQFYSLFCKINLSQGRIPEPLLKIMFLSQLNFNLLQLLKLGVVSNLFLEKTTESLFVSQECVEMLLVSFEELLHSNVVKETDISLVSV